MFLRVVGVNGQEADKRMDLLFFWHPEIIAVVTSGFEPVFV